MNTPFDLEQRLRECCDDIVPQLIARAEAPTEVALLGEDTPVRRQIAGTPRRWSILGAVAAVAAFAAIVFVASRPDDGAPATSPATSASSTGPLSGGEPAWYSALRPDVPERFEYLALVGWSEMDARFVAIDPVDGKELMIAISVDAGIETRVVVRCDVRPLAAVEEACAGPTTGSAVPFTDAEAAAVAGAIDPSAVVTAVQGEERMRLAGPDIARMMASVWPTEWVPTSWGDGPTDVQVLFGSLDSGEEALGGVRIVGDVYPRPAVQVEGEPTLYGNPAAAVFWVVAPSGVAMRMFTTDTTDELLWISRSLASNGTATFTMVPAESVVADYPLASQGTPDWYRLLRPLVPAQFQYLAVESASPDGATYLAIATDGRMLRLTVMLAADGALKSTVECSVVGERDPMAQPPVGNVPCPGFDAPTVIADLLAVDPAELVSAAMAPTAQDAYFAAGLAVAPADLPEGWLGAWVTLDRGASQTYLFGRTGEESDVSVLLVGGVWPGPVLPFTTLETTLEEFTSWWILDPSGFAVRVTVRDGVDLEAARSIGTQQLEMAIAAADASGALPYG